MAGTRLRQGFAGLSSVSPPKLQRRRAKPGHDGKWNHVQGVRKSLKMLADGAGPLFVQGACETIFEVPTRPFLSPREVLLCHQAVGNSASRMHYTLKTPSKQGGDDASVHHVCIVFPFRREGTCQ